MFRECEYAFCGLVAKRFRLIARGFHVMARSSCGAIPTPIGDVACVHYIPATWVEMRFFPYCYTPTRPLANQNAASHLGQSEHIRVHNT